jgi:hypothetical protein
MGWNSAVQFINKTPPLVHEYGILAFTTGGTTVEVPTKLHKILGGIGVSIGASNATPTPVCLADTDITAGCVTMDRLTGGASGASFSYHLWGY